MTIYQSIGQAWATLFGFEKEGNEILFNGKPTYYYNNPITDWETLLDAKPSEIKSVAQVAETPSTRTYDELMQPENFSYGAFDWTNENGTRLGFTLGYYDIVLDGDFGGNPLYFYTGIYGTSARDEGYTGANYGLGYYGQDLNEYYICLGLDTDYTFFMDDYVYLDDSGYTCFYLVPQSTYNFVYAYIFSYEGASFMKAVNINTGVWVNESITLPIDDSMEWNIYFDDGANLPEGVEWDETLESYFVPTIADESTAELVTSQASLAMQGATIMTHCTLWAGGVTMMVFIYSIFAFIKHCFARR